MELIRRVAQGRAAKPRKRRWEKTSWDEYTVRRKLSILLRVWQSKSEHSGARHNARRLFDKLCRQYGIDPKTISANGFEAHGLSVKEVQEDGNLITASIRLRGTLIIDTWPHVQIRFKSLIGGIVVEFRTKLPNRVDEPVAFYEALRKAMDEGWAILKRKKEPKEFCASPLKTRTHISWEAFTSGSGACRPPAHRRSFLKGFYGRMAALLAKEKQRREETKRLAEQARANKGRRALPEPDPFVPPPPNPYALAIVPKVKPVHADTGKPASVPQPEDVPLPPPPDPRMRDPEIEAEAPDLDPDSYIFGFRSAQTVDLNQLSL